MKFRPIAAGLMVLSATAMAMPAIAWAAREAQPARQARGTMQEIAYGKDRLQRLDFYPAAVKGKAPLVVFVHGGGWKRGDKRNATGEFKAPHYNGLGYHFASINYRLVPDATVEQQATDVASALAALLVRADALGIDRSRVVLMGHSAGAHLVALVGTDPQYLRAAGLSYRDVAGIVPLDGAAYDVPSQMGENARLMGDTYKQAFGTDRARQLRLSPTAQAGKPNAPAFLILHVQRPDGTRQSNGLAAALAKSGTAVSVQGFEGRGLRGHAEINRRMGDPDYPATGVVDAWLRQIFAGTAR
ncbi:MAG: alpha/beta hydrolase [Sphingomonadales bacterium]|nr:alpha/beta hydrolase [Sphingomonadales bacterium]MBD3773799.1 alpha/beta hydrolase [Paracoccaceae bacterium]